MMRTGQRSAVYRRRKKARNPRLSPPRPGQVSLRHLFRSHLLKAGAVLLS